MHGVGGFIGTVLVAVFANEAFGGNQGDLSIGSQLGIQLWAAFVTIVYTGVVSYLLIKLVAATVGLRVSEEDEQRGLDLTQHEERGYDY